MPSYRVPDISDVPALVAWMQENEIDLCVAGEEAWLAKGRAQCEVYKFGPRRAAEVHRA